MRGDLNAIRKAVAAALTAASAVMVVNGHSAWAAEHDDVCCSGAAIVRKDLSDHGIVYGAIYTARCRRPNQSGH